MAAWSNLAGTVTGFLRLGLTGVRLKNSAGVLAVRNAGDTADAQLQIADGTAANHGVSKGQADNAYKAKALDNAFSAYASVNQTVVAATYTLITLGTEEFDLSNTFAASRFTPNVAGYYQLNYSTVGITNIAAGFLLCTVYKNGARFRDGSYSIRDSNYVASTGACVVYLNGTTDYAELYTYINGVTIVGASVSDTHFSGFRIG